MSSDDTDGQNAPQKDKITLMSGGYKKVNGVIIGPDGKPCRSCNAFSGLVKLPTKKSASTTAASSTLMTAGAVPPPDCPPDVNVLGHSTWTFLHSLAATYPTTAPSNTQSDMKTFLSIFSRIYPCGWCAEDFRTWMNTTGNEPRLGGRSEFGNWLCEAHNEVNRKLGKDEFDCRKWEERWRDGPKDGSCG